MHEALRDRSYVVRRSRGISKVLAACVGAAACASATANAQPGQDYDFEFVTIGAPGNSPFEATNPPNPLVVGRGRVTHEYRIARLEVTTGQWMEFLNAFADLQQPHPYWQRFGPAHWGGGFDPNFPGPGDRFLLRDVPHAARLPVAGIHWRMAALYCNWLTNGKGSDPTRLVTGAYDSTTWGVLAGTNGFGITDAAAHLPGARFYIPTLDEQLKAMHYDPNRFGPGQGGWWLSKNRSDTPGTPGLPGLGTTSAGLAIPDQPNGHWDIPLGAYPDSTSPWGLLDTSGGAAEHNEELFYPDDPRARGYLTSRAGPTLSVIRESVFGQGGLHPSSPQPEVGLRIASVIPSPGSQVLGAVVAFTSARRRRRRVSR